MDLKNDIHCHIFTILTKEFSEVFYCEKYICLSELHKMNIDDFIPLSKCYGTLEYLSEYITKLDVLDQSSLINLIDGEYIHYFNKDIENNFNQESFSEYWFQEIDLDNIIQQIMPFYKKSKYIRNINTF